MQWKKFSFFNLDSQKRSTNWKTVIRYALYCKTTNLKT